MAIKNYTTEVSEDRTVGEIMGLLASKGARSIKIDYDEQSRPSGVSFVIFIEALPIPFKLPCNFPGVLKAMASIYKDRGAKYRFERNPESMNQARRVGWRIIKDWIASQIALIEAEQASLIQVFLPYAVVTGASGSRTVFDQFMEQIDKQKALPEAPR
jgi:hypothetical protein